MISDILIDFVKESVAHFDESHDFMHALTVTTSAHKIMKSLQNNYDHELLSYMAMLHDVCDHKYPESISRSDLINFIEEQLGNEKMKLVMFVIDNLSWSKEVKGQRQTPSEEISNYLTAVSDADRLEAIGQIGLKRCYEFTKAKNKNLSQDELISNVIVHCNEKLLRLYLENFIVSPLAREIAFPLHCEIEEFVKNPSSFSIC